MDFTQLKKISQESIEKLIKKKVCLLTGTGDLKRTDKIELYSELDVYEVSSAIFTTLVKNGFEKIEFFPVTNQNLNCINLIQAALIFNLVEGQSYQFIVKTIEKIKETKVPFTGSDSEPIKISTDKDATKKIMEKVGVQISPSQVFLTANDQIDEKLKFPLILKPKTDDGSIGITNNSIVQNENELRERLIEYLEKFKKSILVENYVDGREFSTTVIEVNGQPVVLPIAEVHFPNKGFYNKWKIYNFSAKWDTSSSENKAIYSSAPAKNVKEDVEKKLNDWSALAFKALNLHDYARFDYRQDLKTGQLYFLEANANPSLEENPQVETTTSCLAAGLTQNDLLVLIMKSALERFNVKL